MQDRVRFARYVLTGEFPADRGEVGSCLMFGDPSPGLQPRELGEVFFYLLPMDHYILPGSTPTPIPATSPTTLPMPPLVDESLAFVRRALAQLRSWIVGGRLQLRLHHESIRPSRLSCLDAIRYGRRVLPRLDAIRCMATCVVPYVCSLYSHYQSVCPSCYCHLPPNEPTIIPD